MPIYYFNIHNDLVTPDAEGVELADDQAARAYAVRAVRALAADSVVAGHLDLSHHIAIEDEDRKPVATVTFADGVDVRP